MQFKLSVISTLSAFLFVSAAQGAQTLQANDPNLIATHHAQSDEAEFVVLRAIERDRDSELRDEEKKSKIKSAFMHLNYHSEQADYLASEMASGKWAHAVLLMQDYEQKHQVKMPDIVRQWLNRDVNYREIDDLRRAESPRSETKLQIKLALIKLGFSPSQAINVAGQLLASENMDFPTVHILSELRLKFIPPSTQDGVLKRLGFGVRAQRGAQVLKGSKNPVEEARGSALEASGK